MTYDLAVWEGQSPADGEAGDVFRRLYERYIDTPVETPPTPAISDYVTALLARWIDVTEDEDDVSPWSDGPLMNNASGPIIYLAMRPSMADEVSAASARNDSRSWPGLFRSAVGPATPSI